VLWGGGLPRVTVEAGFVVVGAAIRSAQCIGISADAVRTRERRNDELGTKAEIFEISTCRPCVC
jgi:hypothetical protein